MVYPVSCTAGCYVTVITLFIKKSWGGPSKFCPLVVHCWADLQSVRGFRYYDNIAPHVKCQRVLVIKLYAWLDSYYIVR